MFDSKEEVKEGYKLLKLLNYAISTYARNELLLFNFLFDQENQLTFSSATFKMKPTLKTLSILTEGVQ